MSDKWPNVKKLVKLGYLLQSVAVGTDIKASEQIGDGAVELGQIGVLARSTVAIHVLV